MTIATIMIISEDQADLSQVTMQTAETGKEQGKSDFNSGRQNDNSCPRDFWNNVSYCTGYKIGYEAGWGASKILG